jgi:hypothetical protein
MYIFQKFYRNIWNNYFRVNRQLFHYPCNFLFFFKITLCIFYFFFAVHFIPVMLFLFYRLQRVISKKKNYG